MLCNIKSIIRSINSYPSCFTGIKVPLEANSSWIGYHFYWYMNRLLERRKYGRLILSVAVAEGGICENKQYRW